MTSFTKSMKLIFITDDPNTARMTAQAGVNAVMVDLEINGKVKRQGHLDTVISHHVPSAINIVAKAVKGTSADVMVRLNPVFDGSRHEVEDAIERGATRLMLPMFRSATEVSKFLSLVQGRVPVTLLLETATAYARLRQILALKGDYDIHVGLNDLHLEMGLDFMFELLSGGVVEHIAQLCHEMKRPFGIGGVARLSSDAVLAPEDILAEYIRLGSTGVILSRDWRNAVKTGEFAQEVQHLRRFVTKAPASDPQQTAAKIQQIARSIRSHRKTSL